MCDNIEKFIEEVQKHDCIYNLQSPLYKNFYLKQDLWMKIGKSVGITADDARKKWKSIRDSYKRYKQKENQPSGSETVFNKPYKYADSLRFLDDIQNKRSTICNVADSSLETIVDDSSDADTKIAPLKRKKRHVDIQNQMEKLLNTATESINNITSRLKVNATEQLFESLAKKIQEANLTKQQLNVIESAVCSLVYSKINEFCK